jgi:hypothetical protein
MVDRNAVEPDLQILFRLPHGPEAAQVGYVGRYSGATMKQNWCRSS